LKSAFSFTPAADPLSSIVAIHCLAAVCANITVFQKFFPKSIDEGIY
jgi:hypothetical protein